MGQFLRRRPYEHVLGLCYTVVLEMVESYTTVISIAGHFGASCEVLCLCLVLAVLYRQEHRALPSCLFRSMVMSDANGCLVAYSSSVYVFCST